MRVLAINCGSASLKFGVWEIEAPDVETCTYSGSVDWRGNGAAAVHIVDSAGAAYDESDQLTGYQTAIDRVVDWLDTVGGLKGIHAVGHRVVHGGSAYPHAVQTGSPAEFSHKYLWRSSAG